LLFKNKLLSCNILLHIEEGFIALTKLSPLYSTSSSILSVWILFDKLGHYSLS
jgi:hypothetical protein